MKSLKLCYVEELNFGMYYLLFFSQKDATKVWGDDWNDSSYEHNAGEPYKYDKKIFIENFEPLSLPSENYINSPFSVKDINAKKIYWIKFDNSGDLIFANDSYNKVIKILRKNKCKIYINKE